MSIQPKYHWTFKSISNSVATDIISSADARLSNVTPSGQGRIGNAVALNGSDNSYISLGRTIGQFGQADFTIAFGVKIYPTDRLIELLGNRTTAGHGNFFCIRLTPDGKVCTEIDEDGSGTNYIVLYSSAGVDDGTWHHIAVVREQRKLKLYIDGNLLGTETANGVANIANGNELIVGNPNPYVIDSADAPKADFEDLQIYNQALSDQQVSTLIPPLRQGEIELIKPNGSSRIWTTDVNDLSLLSTEFEKLRLGPDTGVTLYKNANFDGISQEVAADLPRLSDTKLGTSPRSVRIWSTVGKPFTGKWAILTPNGQYLSLAEPPLTTSFCATAHELFDFRINVERQYIQLVPGSSSQQAWNALRIVNNAGSSQGLLCVEKEIGFHCFSLVNEQRDRWLKCVPTNRIAIRALSGKYLRADNGSRIHADRSYLLPGESFELISQGSGMEGEIVLLRTFPNGFFVNVGGSNITLGRNTQMFTLENLEGNKISLKYRSYGNWGEQQGDRRVNREGQMNYYISAGSGAGRIFGSPSRGNSETFELIRLEAFDWTTNRDDRAIFTRAIKIAENESQVGELLPGEAAFYEQPAYWGKAWVLYNSCSDFRAIEGLNDTVSSIRLGHQTGATLYSDANYGEGSQDREKDITDIVENIPAFSKDAQLGNDKLSSMRSWSNIPPKQANISFSISMSQDYKLVGEDLQEFTSYRTILKFIPEVKEVEVWATDLTTIEVDGKTYEVDEDRSVKLPPNGMNRLMITSEAEGINTPGLKIRTNIMQSHERVVIFPDREVHRKLANLEDGALWEAKDAKGNLIVNRSTHSADAVAEVQRTITKTMQTVSYVAAEGEDKNQVVDREVSADAIHQPWKLSFTPVQTIEVRTQRLEQSVKEVVSRNSDGTSTRSTSSNTENATSSSQIPSTKSDQPSSSVVYLIQEQELSQDDFTQLLAQASAPLAQGFWKNFRKAFKAAVSKAVSVVVGVTQKVVSAVVDAARQVAAAVVSAVEKVVTVIVTTAEKVVNAVGETVNKVEAWVIDTAEKAGAFVEGVVEKIGVEAKKIVEYLRSLFNWGDILSTQRYLADAIDTGLGYAVKLADAAKEPVNDFISVLRRAANDGLDQTINDLKKDTQSVSGQPQLPEELEWLLSKLTASSSTPSTTASNTPQSVSSSDPLESFFFTFQSGSKSVVDMLLELLKGLGKTIATLILNPSHPQLALIAILEMVRSVTNHALDFINTIAIGFLDCVELAVGKFRTLITADINIPFLKGLFKIIGIDRLSLLNIATLLIAIPVTITSKLIFGKKPFGEPRLAQSMQDEVVDEMNTALKALSSPNNTQGWAITGFVCDAINGLITGLLDASALNHLFFELLSKLLSCTSWLASFPDSPNETGGRPYALKDVSESDGKLYWGRVMWGWRTSVFGINLIAFLVTKAPLKRGTKLGIAQGGVKEAMPVLCMLFAAIDIGISAKYLVSSRETKSDHEEGMRQSAEYVGIFPSILAPLNYSKNPYAAIALGAIDISCAAIVSGLKGDMLRKSYKSLG